ncbi:MAG: putative signal transducing protein [Bacteroidales bacterium]
MEEEFVCVYTSAQPYDAQLVQGLLIDSGIEATVVNKRDSLYLIGYAEVYVKKEDQEIALEIINKRETLREE